MRNLIVFFLLILPGASWAQSVDTIDGKLIQVNQGGQSLKQGASYYVVDPQGKKRAIVKIDSIMEDTAMGTITKGMAQVGWRIVAAQNKPAPPPAASTPPPSTWSGASASGARH